MEARSNSAIDAINRAVFKHDRPIVVALTGGWGEGKTYFWREVIAPKFASINPGYVSVFGAESIGVIRERVALATPKFASLSAGIESKAGLSKLLGPVLGAVKQFTDAVGGSVGVSSSMGVELIQNFSLKQNWVVCIDDVERLSSSVSIETFLGYVTELRDKWKLKVVLIYNNEELSVRDDVFTKYREKVIDREIPFALDQDQITGLVFSELKGMDERIADVMSTKCTALGLRNIRILVKTRAYFLDIVDALGPNAEKDFLLTVLQTLLLLVFTKFSNEKPEGLNFERLRNYSAWNQKLRKAANLVPGEQAAVIDPVSELLDAVNYVATDDLDLVLIDFVQTDVLNIDALRKVHADHLNGKEIAAREAAFREVWNSHYHGTIRNNTDQLCNALEEALPPYIATIPFQSFDFALHVLDRCEKSARANHYLNEFVRLRGNGLGGLDADQVPKGPFGYEPLREFLRGKSTPPADNRNLHEFLRDVLTRDYLRDEEAARIRALTVDELVTYFQNHDQRDLTSKLRFMTRVPDEEVRNLARHVAEKIAQTSPLNELRMKGMGLLD